jgi:hypothetical protein
MLNLVPVVVVLFLLKDPADSDPAFPYFLKRPLARAHSSESSLTLYHLILSLGNHSSSSFVPDSFSPLVTVTY